MRSTFSAVVIYSNQQRSIPTQALLRVHCGVEFTTHNGVIGHICTVEIRSSQPKRGCSKNYGNRKFSDHKCLKVIGGGSDLED